MAQPYVGEIRMFAGNFAPQGWMLCEGQVLSISEFDTLFTLVGTTYGGDGEETFALPDLRGRLPIHQGNGFSLGQAAGVEEVTLTTPQIPVHTHTLIGSTAAPNSTNPQNAFLAKSVANIYNAGTNPVNMAAQTTTPVGGSQPHSNLQPYLCVNFIISLYGIFPSPT